MTSRPRIVADHRERPCGIPDLLVTMGSVDVEVAHLTVGDYVIDDRVVIERKTIDDFAVSIIDERLFRQASMLLRSPYRSALLIEGARSPQNDVPRHVLQGALVSLALVFDIPVLRSRDVAESARILAYCGRQLAETTLQGPGRRRWKPKRAHTRRIHVLSSPPGVGPERAARLLHAFGTIESVVRADAAALAQVPGIGKKTAEAIRALLSDRDQSEP
jgi:ERCC4-type nuclease